MRLGFVVKPLARPELRSHDSRRWQNSPHLSVSLAYLRDVFTYLAEARIAMYRISSELAPYATHPDMPQFHRQVEQCAAELAQLGVIARSLDLRLSFHPAQHVVLNAPGPGNPQVSIDQFSILPLPGAIGNVYNGGSIGWGANIGDARPGIGNTIDLSNDHPISFEWPSGKPGLEASPTNASLRLFGASGRRIECATCHLVHNPSIEPFLAMSNTQSLMCRACHIK